MKTINGKKKNSGGGGGSDKKEPKSNKDEIERYHEIKNTLEDLEREYNRIKKARDRAYGMTKVALIQEEIEKTKELAEAQKQYMTEINDNLIDDQKLSRLQVQHLILVAMSIIMILLLRVGLQNLMLHLPTKQKKLIKIKQMRLINTKKLMIYGKMNMIN